jgi:hypothetical protein
MGAALANPAPLKARRVRIDKRSKAAARNAAARAIAGTYRLDQYAVAAILGTSQATVSRAFRDLYALTDADLHRIASHVGVDPAAALTAAALLTAGPAA